MIPFVRELAFEYGRCDQVSPLIRRVIARNPGPFTYTGTGVYIVGQGEVAVIDPGPDLPEHLEALKAALPAAREAALAAWAVSVTLKAALAAKEAFRILAAWADSEAA